MNNRMKIILPITIVTIVFLILGSTLAYWRWQTQRNEEVNIALTFSGSSDDLYANINGGEPIDSTTVTLLPTNDCTGATALQRTVSITYKNGTNMPAKIEAQLDITRFILGDTSYNLTNDDLAHIHWAITTNATSCSTDIVSSGTFQGITFSNGQISNMTNDSTHGNIYNLNNGNPMITIEVPKNMQSEVTTRNYYVYVWIDENYVYTNYGDENTDPMSDFDLQLTWHGKIYQYIPEPNVPEVVDGLIPVKLSDSGDTVTTVAENDSTWYDYDNKKWANAVLVKTSGVKTRAQNSVVGTVIDESDILAYYVWIPRYSYEVWAYNGTDSAGSAKEIPIKFVSTSVKETATQNGEWYTHPAFTFGNAELSGIWVGKFETSHNTLSTSLGADSGDTICNNTECNNYTGLRVLPNVGSLRDNRISNFFYASRFMESTGNPFGLVSSSIDSHMMKNSEWGAIAYLSHSKYGINGEVRINNNSNYTTGCGALNADDSSTSTCNNAYKTVTTYPQSTTGNVTGVFDMSGGAKEYVMAHFEKVGGFFSSSDTLPDSKYYDNYTFSSFSTCTLTTCGGHALNETMNWYSDGASFVYRDTRTPGGEDFFNRGGNHDDGYLATGIFNASNSRRGYSACHCYSFRLVFVAK